MMLEPWFVMVYPDVTYRPAVGDILDDRYSKRLGAARGIYDAAVAIRLLLIEFMLLDLYRITLGNGKEIFYRWQICGCQYGLL